MRWHAYFLNMVKVIKLKSKDPSTQVGCVIVGPDQEIRSTGFNGMPRGINELGGKYKGVDRLERPEKYFWYEHAERNAIYNAARMGTSLNGCTIYMDWLPCIDCARGIIQSGIKTIILDFEDAKEKEGYWNERWKESFERTIEMLQESKVSVYGYHPDGRVRDFFNE